MRYALWTVVSLALTSAPWAIRVRARRRSLSQAALINCSFSLACSLASGLADRFFVGSVLGPLVAAGLAEVAGEVGCSDGRDAAGAPPLHAVMARTTVARTANWRIGLICRAASAFYSAAQRAQKQPDMAR